MSNGSSSSPGSDETSNSLSPGLGAIGTSTQISTSLPSLKMLPQPANSQTAGSGSFQKASTQAESTYIQLLNQTRITKNLLPDPTGPRILAPETKAKWAVLSVLSTRCLLSAAEVRVLLKLLSYPCSRYAIRRALKRCCKFGLADISKGRPTKWHLTLRGRSLLNNPNKPMKEPTAKHIRTILEQATSWLSVSDIFFELTSKAVPVRHSTIRRCLKRDSAYKSEKIPHDRHSSKQWALATADTAGWADAMPSNWKNTTIGVITKRLSSKGPSLSTLPRTSNSHNYKGLILMCSPNKPSLIKAVGDLLVNEFVTSGKKFSAHDVTKRLREIVLVDTALVDQGESGTVNVYDPKDMTVHKVAKIDHEDVKAIVHDIFNAGGMPSVVRTRDATDSFWEYGPAPAASPSVTGSTTDPDPVSGGTMGSTYDGTSTI